MLSRIMSTKSVFDRTKWAKDREENERYIATIRKDDTAGFLPQGPSGHSVYYQEQWGGTGGSAGGGTVRA